jgi:hypothetical protein
MLEVISPQNSTLSSCRSANCTDSVSFRPPSGVGYEQTPRNDVPPTPRPGMIDEGRRNRRQYGQTMSGPSGSIG